MQSTSRVMANDVPKHEGKEVTLKGWVAVRRDHGKIVFIDLRDASGVVQCVFIQKSDIGNQISEIKNQKFGIGNPKSEIRNPISDLRPEWVVAITGTVNRRPEKLVNLQLATGAHEVLVSKLEILNEARTLPIGIDTDGYEIGEESRLKYRYLDLRRPRLQKNLRLRHRVVKFIRDYLSDRHFIEIDTPVVSKANTETGARNYIIPSRIYPGKFYGLPQSPQQYKQLFMVAGLERYFQIAKCFRDEDTRGDRQPEFTQLDLEMSFVTREDVMELIEDLCIKLVEAVTPEKKISARPFPCLSYTDVMKKYGTDKPDLRKDKNDPNELAFAWIADFPFFEKTDSGGWTFTHNPFSAPQAEHMDWLMEHKNIEKIVTQQYDLVLNGCEIGGGSIRNHRPEALRAVFEIIGLTPEQIEAGFGHMLEALFYGAPPHGGIAPGIDRLVMILANEPNIREVMAFPKTGDGRDLMMDAPSTVDKKQLDELGLEIKKSKKKKL